MIHGKNIARSSEQLVFHLLLTGMIGGFLTLFSYGQSAGELPLRWQEGNIEFLKGHQSEQLQSQTDFYQYSRERDEEFSECLREPWHDYFILPALTGESRSGAISQPVYNYSTFDNTSPVRLPFSEVVGLNDAEIDQIRSVPLIRKPESDLFSAVRGTFLFYGQQINLSYDKLLILSANGEVSENSISGFWNIFSRSSSNHLVDQLIDYRDLLGLGDWGYFQLVKAASNHIFSDSPWRSDQLAWALMIRSGFDVKLAFNQNSTSILFPSHNSIFNRQFVMIGQKRYYLDREMKGELLVTSQHRFPDTEGMIDLRFHKSLNFKGKLSVRRYTVQWKDKKYGFVLQYNPDVIRFYADYPGCDPSVYFGAPVSATLKEDVLRQFYPLLSKFNTTEAAAFLQQYVQRDIDYYLGNIPGGMASGRFAEEVIASKSGDDRGKAVLFSWLVRTLLKLPVMGVQFPGYYSTAVCYPVQLEGDSYFWRDQQYVITDPTFSMAPIGVIMPEFKDLSASLIDFPGAALTAEKKRDLWILAGKMGGRRGGTSQDVIFDRQGRALIAGCFADKRSCHPFVACFSANNSLQWIRKFEGDGKATAFAITKANDDEVYIAGSFSGRIITDGKTIQSEPKRRDLFFAQLNQHGELIWIRRAPTDSIVKERTLPFLVNFDRTGDHINLHWLNDDQRNVKTGFGVLTERGLCFIGSGDLLFGNDDSSGRQTHQDFNSGMTQINGFLNRIHCHPKVAVLTGVLRWLQKPGNQVTGSQIQTLLIRRNPSFPAQYPQTFQAIGRIAMLGNENGTVTVTTSDYKSILMNSLRIGNGARFIIKIHGNNDLAVEAISGINYLVNPLIRSLNSLLIDSSGGNMIIDYDHDHTLKTISPEPGQLF
jgi:hypothetical protein